MKEQKNILQKYRSLENNQWLILNNKKILKSENTFSTYPSCLMQRIARAHLPTLGITICNKVIALP